MVWVTCRRTGRRSWALDPPCHDAVLHVRGPPIQPPMVSTGDPPGNAGRLVDARRAARMNRRGHRLLRPCDASPATSRLTGPPEGMPRSMAGTSPWQGRNGDEEGIQLDRVHHLSADVKGLPPNPGSTFRPGPACRTATISAVLSASLAFGREPCRVRRSYESYTQLGCHGAEPLRFPRVVTDDASIHGCVCYARSARLASW